MFLIGLIFEKEIFLLVKCGFKSRLKYMNFALTNLNLIAIFAWKRIWLICAFYVFRISLFHTEAFLTRLNRCNLTD